MFSIYSNSQASQATRQLRRHFESLAASTRRLSSGMRVNSACDDAAGLAIRELMRSDIAAMRQGVRNANDAISMLQVADGALGIIDEKLIRMKELAEQGATGTYDSTQRLMIHSEFQAMAAEIDRITNATDFNGVKLLDGSLSGSHNGSGMKAMGALKIHFGTANDSAEDYYYVEIADCGTRGLGLRDSDLVPPAEAHGEISYGDVIAWPPYSALNDFYADIYKPVYHGTDPVELSSLEQGQWYCGIEEGTVNSGSENTMLLIRKGVKNLVLNQIGDLYGDDADNDIHLFTRDGKHLAGRFPLPDYNDPKFHGDGSQSKDLASNCQYMGFTIDQYDATYVNKGVLDQDDGATMNFTHYNGMTIGFSGDGAPEYDTIARYEVLYIDEVTEDLIVWTPGVAGAVFKYYLGEGGGTGGDAPILPGGGTIMAIDTQEKSQQALTRLDEAIRRKDKVRAYIGALQNRLENTIANLAIQGSNLQAAESRISDANVALEMTIFVRDQILARSAVAMLSQANSMPQLAARLLQP